MVMGLNTGLWVSAQVRLCDRAFIPATVVRRGDPDAGTVLVKLNRFEAGVTVYTDTFIARTPRGAGHFAPKRMQYFGEMALAELEGVDLMVYAGTTMPVALAQPKYEMFFV